VIAEHPAAPAWAAEKLKLLRDRLAGVRSREGFPPAAPRGLGAVPLPDPAGATLADLAAAEALIAMRDAALLPAPGAARDVVAELAGALGAPITGLLRAARPDLEQIVVRDGDELKALESRERIGVVATVLGFSALDAGAASARVGAIHRLGVPFVYALDRFALPGGGSLVEVLAEHYWPREVPVLPSGFTEPPAEMPPVWGILGREPVPPVVGPAVPEWEGAEEAPRHLAGWRRREP
jgi:hypothetical protein